MTKTSDTKQKDIKLCLAKTKSGGLCQKHPIAGKTRCRLHGGLSSGPTTLEGKAACVAAHWKHGRRSKAFAEAISRLPLIDRAQCRLDVQQRFGVEGIGQQLLEVLQSLVLGTCSSSA